MEPAWTRAFVVAARLAGEDASLLDALDPEARASAQRQWDALAAPSREESVRRLVAARLDLLRPPSPSRATGAGARVLGAWLKCLTTSERAAAVRAMSSETASAVLAGLSQAAALDVAGASAVVAVMRLSVACLGRAMTVHEWSELLDSLSGEGALASEAVVRVERALRLRGAREAAAALARGGARA